MKSFLGFLKEQSTLVDEGLYIGEDFPAGKYTSTKSQPITNKTQLGYYLYFVEYASLTSKNVNNIYFGIKHKPGEDGNPDLFWGSLRTRATGKNDILHNKKYWTDNVIDCDGDKCSPDSTIKNSKIYLSSSSNKNPESLPNTFFVGLTQDKKFHPWIMNTATLKYVKQAANKGDSKITVLPIEKSRNKKIPSPLEYAYKIYVIDDMTELNSTLETVLKNPTSKLSSEVKDFFKEMKDKEQMLLSMLVELAADDVIKKYYQTILEFYKENTNYKKPKEFNSEETYKKFLLESIKNNPWTLVGTFEALGTTLMFDLIKGDKKSINYEHLKNKELQVKSTELSLSLHDTSKKLIESIGKVYFPESVDDDTAIQIAAFMKGVKGEKMNIELKAKRKKEAAEAERKKAEESMKNLLFGGYVSPQLPLLYKAVNDNDKNALAELKKFFIEVELPALYRLEPNTKLNKIFPTLPKEGQNTLRLLKSPAPKSSGEMNTWNETPEKLENINPVKAASLGLTSAELDRRTFYLADFIHLIFNKKLTNISIKIKDFVENSGFIEIKNEQMVMKESVVINENMEKEIKDTALVHVKNIINLEKNPFKNIFFQFNDKEITIHASQLKEDASDDKALNTFKKAILFGANLGSIHNNIRKR